MIESVIKYRAACFLVFCVVFMKFSFGYTSVQTPSPFTVNDDYGNNILNSYPVTDKINVNGTLETATDVDVFKISSKLECDIVINLSSRNVIDISVLNYRGYIIESQLIRTTDKNDVHITTVRFHALKDMKYYLKLTNIGLESINYYFDYEYMVDDYGDTFESAAAISLDQIVTGNFIDQKDVDIFKFTAQEDGVYSIDYPKTECSLTILDENNNNQSPINGFVQLKDNQNYYIKVDKISFPNSFHYAFKIKGPVSDDYGNSMESSAAIKLENVVSGSIDHSIDRDCFSFIPPESGLYFIYGLFKIPDNPTRLIDRYNNCGIEVSDSNGNKMDFYIYDQSISFILNKNVTYYISVSADKYLNLPYKYSFKLKNTEQDDFADTIETAKDITLNSSIKGTINTPSDADCFIFTPSLEGTFCINFNSTIEHLGDINDFPNPKVQNAVSVFDEYGNYMGNTNYDGNSKGYFYFYKNTKYYIYILNINYYPLFSYTFNVEGLVTDDFANKKEYATEIQLGQKVEGKGNYCNDIDYFSFKPELTVHTL